MINDSPGWRLQEKITKKFHKFKLPWYSVSQEALTEPNKSEFASNSYYLNLINDVMKTFKSITSATVCCYMHVKLDLFSKATTIDL